MYDKPGPLTIPSLNRLPCPFFPVLKRCVFFKAHIYQSRPIEEIFKIAKGE